MKLNDMKQVKFLCVKCKLRNLYLKQSIKKWIMRQRKKLKLNLKRLFKVGLMWFSRQYDKQIIKPKSKIALKFWDRGQKFKT